MRIALHVTPRSGRDEIVGWRGGELSVRVTVAPEGGKANAAVCALLARSLGVPKSAVTVVMGTSSRHKQVEADGVGPEDLERVFGAAPEGLF
jgi:uncharacterized protein (TIGR00251 family)